MGDMCLYRNNNLQVHPNNNNPNQNNIGDDGSNGGGGRDDQNNTNTNNGSVVYVIDAIKDRDNATRALMHLTNEAKNHTTMCISTVLDALIKGASITDEEIAKSPRIVGAAATVAGGGGGHKHSNSNTSTGRQQVVLEDVRDSAVLALTRLATEFTNRYTMAHHPGLLIAIAQATEREAKLEEAQQEQQAKQFDQERALVACTSNTSSTTGGGNSSSGNSGN